jgi:chromosome segregation protein
LETARRDALQAETERDAVARRMASLDETARQRRAALERLAAEAVEKEQAGSAAAAALAAAETDLAAAVAEAERVAAAAAASEAELDMAMTAARRARDAQARAATRLDSLSARADALEALFAEAEESEAARTVRAAEAAAVTGSVSQLLEVEPEWESAVAAALGGRALGLVVRDLATVDSALRRLGPETRGQVTLVPASGDAPRLWQGRGPAVGADAVARSATPGLVARLLGEVGFAADVEAARAVLAAADPPMAAATRDGRLVLPGGVVVAGVPSKEILVLARERRELPSAVAAAGSALQAAAEAVDAAAAQVRALETAVGENSASRSRADAARRAAAERTEVARAAAEQAERAAAWIGESMDRANVDLAALATERAALDARAASLATLAHDCATALAAAGQGVDDVDLSADRDALRAAGARASEVAGETAAAQAVAASAERDLAAAVRAVEAHRAELGALVQARQALVESAAAFGANAAQRQAELAALEAEIAPAEVALSAAGEALRSQSGELDGLRRRLEAVDAELGEARVAAARAESRVERLLEQLTSDAEWLPEVPAPSEEPLRAEALRLTPVDALPADCERRIAALRRELRAIGAIDREALATFRETMEHHESLLVERGDLEAAIADLRAALATLEQEMAARFEDTFAVVAREFAATFPLLFGGGEAELLPATEEGPGIDIVARPPGKRRQPLASLSGGERALTGVALVFALLKASGTPFVVLDEVDAALDEANVNRFRDVLENLAERTQVVIITHNRGTVQTANTVYGVSMRDDGASQVVSLQVEALVS